MVRKCGSHKRRLQLMVLNKKKDEKKFLINKRCTKIWSLNIKYPKLLQIWPVDSQQIKGNTQKSAHRVYCNHFMYDSAFLLLLRSHIILRTNLSLHKGWGSFFLISCLWLLLVLIGINVKCTKMFSFVPFLWIFLHWISSIGSLRNSVIQEFRTFFHFRTFRWIPQTFAKFGLFNVEFFKKTSQYCKIFFKNFLPF
jgi:hypothetical protein